LEKQLKRLTKKLQPEFYMNNKFFTCFWVAGCFLFWACHKQPSRQAAANLQGDTLTPISAEVAIDTAKVVATEEIEEEINEDVEEIEFDYLVARSKFSFKSGSQNIDNANVNIRIKKDSIIWLSVTGVGFEVARGIITPDSIVFLDKFHKEIHSYDYQKLKAQFNFDLSYRLIQSIIVGNLPVPRSPNQKFKKEKDYLLLRQDEERISIDNYIGEKTHKLKRLQAVEQPTKNSLTLDYEDFKDLNSYLFPFASLITLDFKSPKDQQYYQTVIRIKHNKVDLVETNPGFPFSIPSAYKRK
jgi:hypothetical protein